MLHESTRSLKPTSSANSEPRIEHASFKFVERQTVGAISKPTCRLGSETESSPGSQEASCIQDRQDKSIRMAVHGENGRRMRTWTSMASSCPCRNYP